METNLVLCTCLFMVALVLAQDTLLIQETHTSHKSKYGHNYATNWTKLEHRIDHRSGESERKLMRRLHEMIHSSNRAQSQQLMNLQRQVHGFKEELKMSIDSAQEKDEEIVKLKQQVTKQHHEIHMMKNRMDRMKKTVANLSSLVEHLMGNNEPTDISTVNNEVPKSTTPTPFRPLFPIDCEDVYINGGMKYPGFYYIMIQPYLSSVPFKVCCKMTNNSGWTLLQRRQDGSVDFFRTWDEYKKGFGNLEAEFWIGNEHIYQLTNQGDYKLRIEMIDWDDKEYWVEYDHFRIADEGSKYRLHVHGYHGNAGDSMTSHWESHDNQPFSTKDNDNDNRFYDNCAQHYHGAWWFKSCFESHLNGVYYHKGSHNNYFVRNGVQWNTIHTHSSLKYVTMMIKPNDAVSENNEYSNGVK